MTVDRPLAYDAYQQLAEHYAARVETKPHNAFYDRPAMLALAGEVAGLTVLDAGCGPGAYTAELLARGAQVIGVDASPKMIALARERHGTAARFVEHDLRQPLGFLGEGEIDGVIAPLVLDYLADWVPTFDEFWRVLKPGGWLVFSIEHPSFALMRGEFGNYFAVERRDVEWHGFGIRILMPSYRRSLEEVIGPLIAAGFRLERLHEPRPIAAFRVAEPAEYERLTRQPGFLCVRASKPPSG